MISELIAANTNVSTQDVERLLSLSQSEIYETATYQRLVQKLNYDKLFATLQEVRDAYDEHLPELIDYLKDEHGFTGKPMTSYTLGNWMLGFLHNTSQLSKLASFHHKIPKHILEEGLPAILQILDDLGDTGQEWKKAMSLLSLPLFANA